MKTRSNTPGEKPDFTCPHCGNGYVDETEHLPDAEVRRGFTCDNCMKPFEVFLCIEPTYHTHKK